MFNSTGVTRSVRGAYALLTSKVLAEQPYQLWPSTLRTKATFWPLIVCRVYMSRTDLGVAKRLCHQVSLRPLIPDFI